MIKTIHYLAKTEKGYILKVKEVEEFPTYTKKKKRTISTKNTTAHNPCYPAKHRTAKRNY